ncbi:MAG: hypothetical protein WDN75_05490 [Bacteroidota bacterium]
MMVPAGQAGAALQGFVNQYTGSTNATDKIPVTIVLAELLKTQRQSSLQRSKKLP